MLRRIAPSPPQSVILSVYERWQLAGVAKW